MPRTCAFCPATANLSGEHIFSEWMDSLFPGRKFFRNVRKANQRWISEGFDWKARVVCETCNNTWMSGIEQNHAKPAMADLMLGRSVPVTTKRANSIALFAFKTAVILDHMNPERHIHFFPRQARNRFRDALKLPDNVTMWMAMFPQSREGGCLANYPTGKLGNTASVELYSCTYVAGHLMFQVLAEIKPSGWVLNPASRFEGLIVKFWPSLDSEFQWPLKSIFQTTGDIRRFSDRWKNFTFTNLTGD